MAAAAADCNCLLVFLVCALVQTKPFKSCRCAYLDCSGSVELIGLITNDMVDQLFAYIVVKTSSSLSRVVNCELPTNYTQYTWKLHTHIAWVLSTFCQTGVETTHYANLRTIIFKVEVLLPYCHLSKYEILKQQPNVEMKAYKKYFGERTIEMAQLWNSFLYVQYLQNILCALLTKPISIS